MMRRTIYPIAVLCMAGLLVPAARAEDKDSSQDRQTGRQPQQQRDQQKDKKIAAVSGKLQDLRTINLKGEGKHVVAKLLTGSGKTLIVDLGRPGDLKGQKFRRNQEISILGRAGRINGRPIIVADRMRSGTRPEMVLTIVRLVPMAPAMSGQQRGQTEAGQAMQAAGQQQQQQRQQQQQVSHVVAGRLLETREVTLKGMDDKHVLARVQTPQGRQVLVDLGTRKDLGDHQLSRGDVIATMGTFGRINGRPVLFAERFSDLITIDRSDESAAQQAAFQEGEPKRSQRQQQQQPQQRTDSY